MQRVALVLVMAVMLASCVTLQDTTIGEVKAGLQCVTYGGDLTWKQVAEILGDPDIFPKPEPGSNLTANTRVYKKSVVIFATGLKEVQEGEKTRFVEAVTGLEICRHK